MSPPVLLAAAALLALGLGVIRPPRRTPAGDVSRVLELLVSLPVPGPFIAALARLPVGPRVRDGLRAARLSDRELYIGRAAGSCVTLLATMPIAAFAAPLGGVAPLAAVLTPFAVDRLVVREASRHGARVVCQLPDALDLLSAATAGGMALDPALELVGQRLGGAIGRELQVLRSDMERGAARSAAYEGLRRRVPLPQVDQVVGALLRADRLGSPLAETLARQADAMRHSRAQRARDAAARAGPKIQLVVALLMVPATLMLVIGLLVIELTRQVNAVIGAG